MRAIDADELIKWIEDRYEITWEADTYEGGIKDACSDMLEKIDNMPTIEPQHWIPCSERLPEDKTAYYLATVANRGLFFTTTLNANVECVRWDYDRRKGQDSWHWCTERTVIAWMPLPEPYKEAET